MKDYIPAREVDLVRQAIAILSREGMDIQLLAEWGSAVIRHESEPRRLGPGLCVDEVLWIATNMTKRCQGCEHLAIFHSDHCCPHCLVTTNGKPCLCHVRFARAANTIELSAERC